MRKITFDLDFKTELSNIEIAGIESIVTNILYNDSYLKMTADCEYKDNTIYTSQSKYAALYHNAPVTFDCYTAEEIGLLLNDEYDYTVKCFTLAWHTNKVNTMLIAVLEDENENEYFVEIEASDFYY